MFYLCLCLCVCVFWVVKRVGTNSEYCFGVGEWAFGGYCVAFQKFAASAKAFAIAMLHYCSLTFPVEAIPLYTLLESFQERDFVDQ